MLYLYSFMVCQVYRLTYRVSSSKYKINTSIQFTILGGLEKTLSWSEVLNKNSLLHFGSCKRPPSKMRSQPQHSVLRFSVCYERWVHVIDGSLHSESYRITVIFYLDDIFLFFLSIQTCEFLVMSISVPQQLSVS